MPIVLSGADLLATAQTGSGKTAAFALPLLQRWLANPPAAGTPTPANAGARAHARAGSPGGRSVSQPGRAAGAAAQDRGGLWRRVHQPANDGACAAVPTSWWPRPGACST